MNDMHRMPAHGSRHGGQWPTHKAKARRRKKFRPYPVITIAPKRDQR